MFKNSQTDERRVIRKLSWVPVSFAFVYKIIFFIQRIMHGKYFFNITAYFISNIYLSSWTILFEAPLFYRDERMFLICDKTIFVWIYFPQKFNFTRKGVVISYLFTYPWHKLLSKSLESAVRLLLYANQSERSFQSEFNEEHVFYAMRDCL